MSGENKNPNASLPADLITQLDRGVLVITPNERAARRVRRLYDQHKQQMGVAVWSTVKAMSLNAWLKRIWNDAVTEGRIVSPVLISQEHSFALWEQIIRASAAGKDILNISGAAELAQQAFDLLHLYGVPARKFLPLDSAETRAFHPWATQYQKRLNKEKWTDESGLFSAVIHLLAEKSLPAPAGICLYAMEDLRPAEESLLAALRTSGCTITEFAAPMVQSHSLKLQYEDVEQEIEYAAQWARKRLIKDPTAHIGVVVPQLSSLRQKVERTFLYELQYNTFLKPDAADQRRAFEISLGTPLSDHPLVSTALLVLRLACGKIELPDIGSLLRSPFLGGASEELSQRSLLEAELRSRNILNIDIVDFLRIASETKNGAPKVFTAPIFCEKLSKLNAASLRNSPKKKPGVWNKIFLELLEDTGWPDDRPLNSSEYQAQQKFKKLLADFAALDSVLPEMKLPDAVQYLQCMSSRQTFQPENLDAPVQVLGPLEAAGSYFDHLWVLGLHEDAWPASAAPNPFLPLLLQRKHNMPHSSSAVDLEFTQKLTSRLLGSAEEVIVSFAKMDADRELSVSPLVKHLPTISKESLAIGGKNLQAKAAPEITEWSDSPFPLLSLSTDSTHQGGTRIFDLQSACSFRAFATIRLHAEPLDEPALGMDARQRGSLAHEVMFAIWNEIKDSQRLKEFAGDPAKFDECIRSNVQTVLQDQRELRGDEWHRRYAELESVRLVSTVKTMLDIDLQRAQSFTVEHKEEKELIELGGIRMSIRKDRVDKLADGRNVIIDYKSGEKNPGAWKNERPEEPQLPVYAVTTKEPLAAIAFANLKTGKEGYAGISASEGILPDVKIGEKSVLKTNFSDQITAWRAPLENLAADYIAGSAVVAPKKRVETCKHCELQTLCRIAELDPANPLAEEEENGGEVHE